MRALVYAVLLMALSLSVSADSIRCGRKIVKTGDTVNTLIRKCGQPQRKFNARTTVNENGRQSKVSVSNWVYHRARKMDMVVSVRSGAVVQVRVD